ncbi:MAG: flagellar motor switch protein FliN [Armatimonadota bacterium]|nr:flagellar motor switch protein FliN [bacterium]
MGDEVLSQAEIEALLSGAGQSSEAAAETPAEAAAAAPEQSAEAEQMEPVSAPAPAPAAAPQPNITVSSAPTPGVRAAAFAPMASAADSASRNGVELIMDVRLNVAVELGRSTLSVREILALGPGKVVELDKHAGEPVEVVINNKTVARGEVVVIDENFGVRITEIIGSRERESHAKAA